MHQFIPILRLLSFAAIICSMALAPRVAAQSVVSALPKSPPTQIADLGTTDGPSMLINCWWSEFSPGVLKSTRVQEKRSYFSPTRGELDKSLFRVHEEISLSAPSHFLRDTTYYYFVQASDAAVAGARRFGVWRKPIGAGVVSSATLFYNAGPGLAIRAIARDGDWLYLALSVESGAAQALILQRRHVVTGRDENVIFGNPSGVSDFRVSKLSVGPMLRPLAWGETPRTCAVLLNEAGGLWFVEIGDPLGIRQIDASVKDFTVGRWTVLRRPGGGLGLLTPVVESVLFASKFNPSLGREQVHRQSLDDLVSTPFPIFGDSKEPTPTALAVDSGHLFVATQGDGNVRVFRYQFPDNRGFGGKWDLIAAAQPGPIPLLASNGRQLYFATPQDIRRIDANAPAIEFVARALGLEMVQAVQNLNNEVPLVVNKPTLVRAYAAISRNSLPNGAWFPTGQLRGFRGGQELPGSPLPPNNGKPVALATVAAGVPDEQTLAGLRGNLELSFNFDLPASWIDRAAEVTLRFVLDPSNSLPESPVGRGRSPSEDNIFEVTRPFVHGGRPTLVFVPLRCAQGPDYVPGRDGYGVPDFNKILARAKSLLPVEEIDVRFNNGVVFKKQIVFDPLPRVDNTVFIFGAPAFGLSNLDGEWVAEAQWALLYTAIHAMFSPRQPGKDVHWVGAVAPMERGFNGVGGVPGMTFKDLDPPWWLKIPFGSLPLPETPLNTTMVVRMSATNESSSKQSWNDARGGFSLAHELGHNYGRFHLNQKIFCGGQEPDGPYHSYPYASGPCTLGSSGIRENGDFIGYDSLTQSIVPPDKAGDLMSYSDSRWISPFTWNATLRAGSLLAGIPAGAFARASTRKTLNPQPLPPKIMAVAGLLTPDGLGGAFLSSQIIPSALVDPTLAGLSLDALKAASPDMPFKIRQLDAKGGVLSEQPLLLLIGSDDSRVTGGFPFVQAVAPEASLATVQLVARDGQVVSERTISPNAPVITLDPLIVDATAQSLLLRWQAHDADLDPVHYTVQFSADDGASWQLLDPLRTPTEITLDLRQLPGGPKCRIRVAATDGLHTTVAETVSFTLKGHAPDVGIEGMKPGEMAPFGDRRVLAGTALDMEDGMLDGATLRWSLQGPLNIDSAGPVFPLSGLPPGAYALTLSGTDTTGQTGSNSISFRVGPLSIPVAEIEPALDGFCNDEAYRNAALLRVRLSGGGLAEARLVRANGSLYVGWVDLPYGPPGAPPTRAGVVISNDAGRDAQPLPIDRGYYVDETGVPTQEVGGAGRFGGTTNAFYGFSAFVMPGETAWSAEFKLEETLLGEPGDASGLLVNVVRDLDGRPANDNWPPEATLESPKTWGEAFILSVPPAALNQPPVARTGPPQTAAPAFGETLYLHAGESFDPEGAPLTYVWKQVLGPPVTILDSTQALARFVASPVTEKTTLKFALEVHDGLLASTPAEAVVVLFPPPQPPSLAQSSFGSVIGGDYRGSLKVAGRAGDRIRIEATTDFIDWQPIGTASLDFLAKVAVTDPEAAKYPYRFYRAASSAPEVEPNYPDGLVSLWRGEGDASDALGKNPGELLGNVEFGPGRYGRAFHFNGRGQGVVKIPDSSSLRAERFTICAWVQLEPDGPTAGFAPGNLIFGKARASAPGQYSLALRIPPQPGVSGYITYPVPPASFGTVNQQHWWTANTNTWYHIAMTGETNRLALFLNGVRLPSSGGAGYADGHGPEYDEGGVSIGAGLMQTFNTFSHAFHGYIDEVAFFDRVLPDAEVEAIAGFHALREPAAPGTIIYARADGTTWALAPDGKTLQFVTVGTQPILSPDRSKLLFRRFDGSPGGVVLARDLITGMETTVQEIGVFSLGFSWFPDSRRAALDDFNLAPSTQGFRSLNVDDRTSNVVMLVRKTYDSVPVVSPDGLRVLFHNFSGNTVDQGGIYSGILDTNLALQAVARFANTAYGDAWPSWSPDGKRLSFTDGKNLFVMNSDGSQRAPLTAMTEAGDRFSTRAPFTPEGDGVVAAGVVGNVRGLYRIHIRRNTLPALIRALPRIDLGSSGSDDQAGSVAR